eukprot:scaffold167647_cov33-Cyclotella_meneghiniana.AAC.1
MPAAATWPPNRHQIQPTPSRLPRIRASVSAAAIQPPGRSPSPPRPSTRVSPTCRSRHVTS